MIIHYKYVMIFNNITQVIKIHYIYYDNSLLLCNKY